MRDAQSTPVSGGDTPTPREAFIDGYRQALRDLAGGTTYDGAPDGSSALDAMERAAVMYREPERCAERAWKARA